MFNKLSASTFEKSESKTVKVEYNYEKICQEIKNLEVILEEYKQLKIEAERLGFKE
jgi:hypothetical protein